MNDDLIQRINDATQGGLDIILWLCPDAAKCIDGRDKHFKLRADEKTASATLTKLTKTGNWYVKDFGGSFSGGAINLYMYLEGRDIKTAIKELGARYNCLEGKSQEVQLPTRSKTAATELEKEDDYGFDIKDKISDFEMETLFAKSVLKHSQNANNNDWYEHLRKVCAQYGFFSLESFWYIKDRQKYTVASTDVYPIFMIDGKDFKKIYQPKSLDKKYRFRYFGKKDNDYIFGLARFNKTFNDLEAKMFSEKNNAEEENEPTGSAFQLDDLIICSGDRDSLNVAALGYNVIWLNSESAKLPGKTYNELKKKARNVYNLPDLDATGVKQAHSLALFYLDLKTIQLPAELLERRDWRGNPCKDVRDYLSFYDKKDFDNLVKSALEYKFWDEESQYNKQGEWKKNVYVFNNVRAYNFISKSGFHRLESKTAKDGYEYIQIDKNIVKTVTPKDIKSFINAFLEKRFTADQQLRNTFYRSTQLKDEGLDNLKYVTLDFKYYDKDYQYFFFLNKTWKVTQKEVIEHRPGEVNKMVWEEKVIQHNTKLLEAPFTIKETKLADDSIDYDIEIHNNNCLFFKYLVNTSRIHWRKELEERLDEKYSTEEEREKYREEHKCNIAGPLLTAEEQHEQKQHLINKLYVLGYILCRNKEKSKPWAPFLMDHKLSAEGESNGGSGKTIFARSVEYFLNLLLLDGKSKSLLDDKHALESVTEKTEVILVDDLGRFANIESYFSMITEGITVNPKYNARFTLDYKNAPKIIFTSNYGVKDITSSAERRLIYASFADYFHNNTAGVYREERTPAHIFGKDLFSDFTDDEWIYFINTMVCALQVFYTIPNKFNPPMDNVLKRNLQGIMGDAFLNWADVYFSEGSGHLNKLVSKEDASHDLLKTTNDKWITQRFMARLEAWCKYYRYSLNPDELKGSSGRIIKKVPIKKPDGTYATTLKTYKNEVVKEINQTKAAEMIYIKTVDGKLNPDDFKDHEEEPETEAAGTIFSSAENEDEPAF